MIHFDFTPGDYVINPKQEDWGIGQVQSIIKNKVTVNFQNQGKQVINGEIAKRMNQDLIFDDKPAREDIKYNPSGFLINGLKDLGL